MVPVLGNHYGRVLAAGEVQLAREEGSFVFQYFDHAFPGGAAIQCAVTDRGGGALRFGLSGVSGQCTAPIAGVDGPGSREPAGRGIAIKK